MTRILRLECSPNERDAHSRRFGDEVLARLQRHHPDARVVLRDLAGQPLPAIDAVYTAAMLAHRSAEDSRGVAALALSEMLIGEVETSDVLLIGTPMHNFTVPAALKVWIDHVVRVGRTFRGTPDGKVGLLRDRPTYIVVSSGGPFSGEAARQPDFLTPYLTAILATLGIRQVSYLHLEGLTRGDEALARAYAAARSALDALLPPRH